MIAVNMMAFYLVTGQVDKVVGNISQMKDLSYDRIPRYYDEALIIYTVSGGGPVDLGGFAPDPGTMQRFNSFDQQGSDVYAQTGDMAQVRSVLAEHFGDSFMYYLNFELPRAAK